MKIISRPQHKILRNLSVRTSAEITLFSAYLQFTIYKFVMDYDYNMFNRGNVQLITQRAQEKLLQFLFHQSKKKNLHRMNTPSNNQILVNVFCFVWAPSNLLHSFIHSFFIFCYFRQDSQCVDSISILYGIIMQCARARLADTDKKQVLYAVPDLAAAT